MSRHPTVMTPEVEAEVRRRMAEGQGRTQIARETGLSKTTLYKWAVRCGLSFPAPTKAPHGVFSPAHQAAARANIRKASAAKLAKWRLPLNPVERRRYNCFQEKARKAGVSVTRNDIFLAIGRADLVGQP